MSTHAAINHQMCDISANAIAQTSCAISTNFSYSNSLGYAENPARIILGLYCNASSRTWSKSTVPSAFVLYLWKLNTLEKKVTGAPCVKCHPCVKSIQRIVSPGSISAEYTHKFAAAHDNACTFAWSA